jgi:cardiolipin synthase
MANAITWTRVSLAPLIVVVAALGQGRLVLVCLVLAGATDVIDGPLARRQGTVSDRGARLDAAADFLILVATAVGLVILHPEVIRDNAPLLVAAGVTYAASAGAPPRPSTKVAGALLYGFALFTFGTGAYVPVLLWIAALALVASSIDGVIRAVTTRLVMQSNSNTRSQAPHAWKEVGSRTRARTSIATSATPSTNKTRP